MQPFGRHHMEPDQLGQRRKRRGAGTNPIGQGGDIEFDPLAGEGLALAVQGDVLTELGLDDHRQQVGSRPAARDRVEGRRRLGDRLAGPAGELLPDCLDHLPLPGDHLQGLGDRLAELGELAAAAWAGARAGEHPALARQMLRQRLAHRRCVCLFRFLLRRGFAGVRLQLLKLQFQLIEQFAAAFGGGAEPVVAELGDQQLQVRDHRLRAGRTRFGLAARLLFRGKRCAQGVDLGGRIGRGGHSRSESQFSAEWYNKLAHDSI
jgi:hypothetical protein